MIGLLQRVTRARVDVDGECTGEIGQGLLVLVGVRRDDALPEADRLLDRLLTYRVFEDGNGRMNLDLAAVGGGLLLVPQFTLVADTRKGRRPSFSAAAEPAEAERLFDYLLARAAERVPDVQSGRFGADMAVSLVNDGPVTFWLES
ncbi:MAG: D-tyrosyl-tRNA(Tyr) deacylase [Chromatiaceae bacterium]|nr:D-tyrosyl-tRNA(Tyr) deacylase [Gammaproteobacteria bacterium]MCP5300023.1 D-tyrosyl-tRNA(Tyr) deacylase [Chromatiaceae bacterium]MCP5422095.1 D-tyrosyl-tRNA(Tyr) deacylase [Chromatiaceae bacterium]